MYVQFAENLNLRMQFYSIYIERQTNTMPNQKHAFRNINMNIGLAHVDGKYAKLHLEITLDMISQIENMAVGEDQLMMIYRK